MSLFIVVLAIAFLQVWAGDNPLHRDLWYFQWIERIRQRFSQWSLPWLIPVVSILIPLLGCVLVLALLRDISGWLILPFGVIILLYSFGRGEFGEIISEYTRACYEQDWISGLERAARLGVHVEGLEVDDWTSLHQQVLDEAAYRGFERMFAVLFWFFVLGPVGALGYRLLFLYNQNAREEGMPDLSAARALWLVEWPAVRLLGLSFSFTGNFVGCYNRWAESVFCLKSTSSHVLGQAVLGALSVDDELTQTCEVTRKELSLLNKLFTRTLWFWLAVAALLTLLT